MLKKYILDDYFFDLGNPIHRGVLSIYSWYFFPYVLRQYCSSADAVISRGIVSIITMSRKSHDKLIIDILIIGPDS
jgi:hypothetical protein